VARLEGRDTEYSLFFPNVDKKATRENFALRNADARFQNGNFFFQLFDPLPVRFDCFDQAVESGMQIMIARIGERNGKFRGRVLGKIKVLFFW
jgi:hypothetical protein